MKRAIPRGEWSVLYEACSLRANNTSFNVPVHRPMSLEELESLFNTLYLRTPANQSPVLPVQDQLLAQYVHNNEQRNLLGRPGRGVAFTPGRVNAHQIHSKRPSYINALIIQSRGVLCRQPCLCCWTRQGHTTFPECHQILDAFGGCCANCKWPDQAV
jgi:hypothetical protein